MKSSAGKIQVTTYEDLFSMGQKDTGERVQEIALSELFPFQRHPFRVVNDAAMKELVESIRKQGVLVPGLARPRMERGYELISGHRRKYASALAGRTTMPVIIWEMDDEEAILHMVDSNVQRENLLPSEKAWAYRMKLEAIRRKAGRPGRGSMEEHPGQENSGQVVQDLREKNSGQVVQNFKGKVSVEIVAGEVGENYKQVQRYIRLTELLPELLQMVDEKKLAFNPAVELSYLTHEEQRCLLEEMKKLSVVPSLEQAKRLKRCSQESEWSREVVEKILTERASGPVQVVIGRDRLRQYFPENYTRRQMEEVIYSLLEQWKKERKL